MSTCIILIVNLPPEWKGMDQFMYETSETTLLCNFITVIILMKVYNMTILAKYILVKFYTCHCLSHTSCILSCSLLHCIFGLVNMGGIVISSDGEVIKG